MDAVFTATAAHAENGIPPMASKSEDVGLPSAQLPGAVMLVARCGTIYTVQASADDTRFLRNPFRSMVQAAMID